MAVCRCAAAATRIDLAVENNLIATVGQDSICQLDNINYENQSKRLQLINNRDYPRNPGILKRLILAFEQLKDTGKMQAFLKAYLKINPEDTWSKEKLRDLKMCSYKKKRC